MKWLLVALIILLFFLLVMIVTKITIFLSYSHRRDDDHLNIEFRIWFGLIRYKKTIPLIKVDEKNPSIIVKEESVMGHQNSKADEKMNKITLHEVMNKLKNYQELLNNISHLNLIIKKFLNKVSVKQLEWSTVIGVGDAPHTGMASGALWALKGGIIGMLSHYFTIKVSPKIMVYPNFQQAITETNLKCMFQFRIGHAMLAGLKLIKFWKGGRSSLKSTRMMSSLKI